MESYWDGDDPWGLRSNRKDHECQWHHKRKRNLLLCFWTIWMSSEMLGGDQQTKRAWYNAVFQPLCSCERVLFDSYRIAFCPQCILMDRKIHGLFPMIKMSDFWKKLFSSSGNRTGQYKLHSRQAGYRAVRRPACRRSGEYQDINGLLEKQLYMKQEYSTDIRPVRIWSVI